MTYLHFYPFNHILLLLKPLKYQHLAASNPKRCFYVRRKKSKKVSKSLVFFSRGHAAADVTLGLVDLQHLLDLQV